MVKKLFVMTLLAGFAMLTGCNTMSGFGKDVEKVGDKIENKADKNK